MPTLKTWDTLQALNKTTFLHSIHAINFTSDGCVISPMQFCKQYIHNSPVFRTITSSSSCFYPLTHYSTSELTIANLNLPYLSFCKSESYTVNAIKERNTAERKKNS